MTKREQVRIQLMKVSVNHTYTEEALNEIMEITKVRLPKKKDDFARPIGKEISDLSRGFNQCRDEVERLNK